MSFGFTGSECGLKGYKVVSFFFPVHSLYYWRKQSHLNNWVQHSEMHGHKKRTSISPFPPRRQDGACLTWAWNFKKSWFFIGSCFGQKNTSSVRGGCRLGLKKLSLGFLLLWLGWSAHSHSGELVCSRLRSVVQLGQVMGSQSLELVAYTCLLSKNSSWPGLSQADGD